jgi:hypothetical protein
MDKIVDPIYLYLHSKLEKKISMDRNVNLKEAVSYINTSYNIPVFLIYAMLSKMKQLGMIQRVNRYKIRVNEYPDNQIINNPSRILELSGCWEEEKDVT